MPSHDQGGRPSSRTAGGPGSFWDWQFALDSLAILAPVKPVYLLLLTSLAAAPSQAQEPLAGLKPNIVLLLADDLSYRDLSIWGQDRFSTPHLDRLAEGGLRFTQAYAGGPACAPSRGHADDRPAHGTCSDPRQS